MSATGPAASAGAGGDAATGGETPGTAPGDGAAAAGACDACPLGAFVGQLRAADPETVDHLVAGLRELLTVVRRTVDVADRFLEHQQASEPGASAGPGPRVQRIDVE